MKLCLRDLSNKGTVNLARALDSATSHSYTYSRGENMDVLDLCCGLLDPDLPVSISATVLRHLGLDRVKVGGNVSQWMARPACLEGIVSLATQEAAGAKVGTEHLLLALMQQVGGTGVKELDSLKINDVRAEIARVYYNLAHSNMPVIKIWNVPAKLRQDKLEEVFSGIEAVLQARTWSGPRSKDDFLVLFPSDEMEFGRGVDIYAELCLREDGLLGGIEARGKLARDIGLLLHIAFPASKVRCEPVLISPKEVSWSFGPTKAE